jgi:hypothetical protein
MINKKTFGFWLLISLGLVLTAFLVLGQTLSLFNYEGAVRFGMQESITEVGATGVAYGKGFAFSDTIIYLPLLILGLIGITMGKNWGLFSMFGALAISLYWPIVCLFSIYIGKSSMALSPDKYISYPIVLGIVIVYSIFGLWFLYKNQKLILN